MTKAPRLRHRYTRKPNLAEVKTAGHDTLRLVNRRILLSLISDRQPISRAEIAKVSGLNKATVSTITNELLKDRYVIETGGGKTTPSGGKPPTPLRINEQRYGLFGLDIRAEETILALSNFNAHIVARHSFKTGANPATFLRHIGEEITRLRAQHREFTEIAGIGISMPGLVDSFSGKFLMSVVLPWRDVPVVELLEQATGLHTIMDTSARCAALAEIWYGKTRYEHVRNLLYVSVSSGLSCGVVIDGGLYRGFHNTAGQFGHFPIDLNGPECRCGMRGCWDLFASDKATVARYEEVSKAVRTTRKPGTSKLNMRRVVELVESGDTAAMQAVRTTAKYLGLGITGLVNGLDPEEVVIGGEITKAWGLIEPIILAEVQRNLRAREVVVRRSSFEVRPTLKGALTLILNELLSVPQVG